jgi:hypothetical protein
LNADKITSVLGMLRVKGYTAKQMTVTFSTPDGKEATIPFEIDGEVSDITKEAEEAIQNNLVDKKLQDDMAKAMRQLQLQAQTLGGAQSSNPFGPQSVGGYSNPFNNITWGGGLDYSNSGTALLDLTQGMANSPQYRPDYHQSLVN